MLSVINFLIFMLLVFLLPPFPAKERFIGLLDEHPYRFEDELGRGVWHELLSVSMLWKGPVCRLVYRIIGAAGRGDLDVV